MHRLCQVPGTRTQIHMYTSIIGVSFAFAVNLGPVFFKPCHFSFDIGHFFSNFAWLPPFFLITLRPFFPSNLANLLFLTLHLLFLTLHIFSLTLFSILNFAQQAQLRGFSPEQG